MNFAIGAGPPRRINHEAADSSIPRRAQITRNQRRNAPQPTTSQQDSEEDSDGESNRPNPFAGEKMGAKKRAKLEAKAEKRQQREAEMLAREVKLTNKNSILSTIMLIASIILLVFL